MTGVATTSFLQIGGTNLDLIEWFLASAALVVVITLVYVFVLGRSPPPEGPTEAKLEMQTQPIQTVDVSPIIAEARSALSNSDFKKAVELSV